MTKNVKKINIQHKLMLVHHYQQEKETCTCFVNQILYPTRILVPEIFNS